MKHFAVVMCVLLLASQTADAWNFAGHRAIAFLTYSILTPKARQRVDQLVKAHPDYQTLLARTNSTRPSDIARDAFVTAATWPDMIRNDPRFSDNGSLPAPTGFTDSHRHAEWHFINTPWPSEFSKQPVGEVNAVSQIKTLSGQLSQDARGAYALSWLVHLVSDLHNPLHVMTRYERREGKPEHDRGGNSCYVEPGRTLHGFWDSLLGRDASDSGIARLAASLADENPATGQVDTKPENWVKETLPLIGTHVYSFGRCADKAAPVKLTRTYTAKAEQLARNRAALAAYRLAQILNDKLGK